MTRIPDKEELVLSLQLLEKQHDKYKAGFNLLMEYWDSLPDEEKESIDTELKSYGL